MKSNGINLKLSPAKIAILSAVVVVTAAALIIVILVSNHRRELYVLRAQQYDRDYRISQQQMLVDTMQNEIVLLNASSEVAINEMSAEIYELMEVIDELVASLPPGITTETVQASVRQVAELTTLVHEYTDVTVQDESNFWTNRLLIIRYSGRIRAGVDFSNIGIAVDGYRIIVRIPPARIFSHELPFETIDVVRDETGIFTPSNTIPDFVELMAELQRDKEVGLINAGILVDARNNAQETIRQLIYTMIIAQRGNPADFTITFND